MPNVKIAVTPIMSVTGKPFNMIAGADEYGAAITGYEDEKPVSNENQKPLLKQATTMDLLEKVLTEMPKWALRNNDPPVVNRVMTAIVALKPEDTLLSIAQGDYEHIFGKLGDKPRIGILQRKEPISKEEREMNDLQGIETEAQPMSLVIWSINEDKFLKYFKKVT